MIIYLLFFIPIVFLCFFLLFIFSRQDFVLLRQNISVSDVFNYSVISAPLAFLFARIFAMINDFNSQLLNILAFFHFIKFPGLSYIGFFLGGIIGIYLLARAKKGLARIFDIFSLSFFPLLVFFILHQVIDIRFWHIVPMLFIVAIIIFIFLNTAHGRYTLRDGSISSIFLLIVSISIFILDFFPTSSHDLIYSLSFSQVVSIPIAVFSLLFLFLNQKGK